MIRGIPAADIAEEWDNLKPFFEGFAKRSRGRWSVDWLLREALEQRKQVWCVNDFQAVCLTSVGDDHVNLEAGAGVRRHEWQDEFDATLRAWARSLGKKRIFALARPGWAKYGKAKGYREIHREFVLEL